MPEEAIRCVRSRAEQIAGEDFGFSIFVRSSDDLGAKCTIPRNVVDFTRVLTRSLSCLRSFLPSFPHTKPYQYHCHPCLIFCPFDVIDNPATSTYPYLKALEPTILLNIQLRWATRLKLAPRQVGLHHISHN